MTHYIDSWNRKLAEASAAHKKGQTVWYRRDDYFDAEFAEEVPKWHVFADRFEVADRKGTYTWKALCGYKHSFNEILLALPRLRLTGPPRGAERCTRCDTKRKKLLGQKAMRAIEAAIPHLVTTKVGTMSDQPVFHGTPDDWWENAERISTSEAAERDLGSWYISKYKTAGGPTAYRIAQPSRVPNLAARRKIEEGYHANTESEAVRCLIRVTEAIPEWMTATYVLAEKPDGGAEKFPWVRKKNGRWTLIADGSVTLTDRTMAELNPKPATFTVAEDLI